MTLQQCRYLIEIDRHHSISKAASALFVTQPSISKAIKDLEEELRIVILERTNRGVSFTKEGEELLFYARMLIEQEETIRYHFNANAHADLLQLSIASQHFGFAVEAMAQLINRLSSNRYALTFLEGKASDVIEHVASGRSMLGILSVSVLNRELLERYFLSRSLTFVPLLSLQQHVFLQDKHPLARHSVLSLEQLSPYPCLTYRQDDVPLSLAEDSIGIQKTSRIIYLKDRGTMNNLLAHTDGYNLGTGCIVKGYMNRNIISIPLKESCQTHIGYIKRHEQLLSDEALSYLDFLHASLQASIPKSTKRSSTIQDLQPLEN